jgi:hypothetical protein
VTAEGETIMRRLVPHWRKMTWVINIVNLLFLVWLITGVSSRPSKDCASDPSVTAGTISKSACEAASDVGTGIGVALIIFLWFIVFIVLGLVWLMTRPKNRLCPVCGEDVKKGRTTCKKCGHDFADKADAAPPVAPPPMVAAS